MLTTTVTFAGNLAETPQLNYTRGGKPVAEFRVFVNHRTKDENDQWVAGTPTVHHCKAYGQIGENIAASIDKGHRVIVHGETRTETWKDKDTSENRYKDVVLVEEIGVSLQWAISTPVKLVKPPADQAGQTS